MLRDRTISAVMFGERSVSDFPFNVPNALEVNMRMHQFAGLLFLVVVVGVGCSQPGPAKPKTPQATISGTVSHDGKPLPAGCEVVFFHKDQGATLATKVDSQGKFNLVAADPRIGIPTGKYQVAIRPAPAAAPAVQPTGADYEKLMTAGAAAAPAAPPASASKDIPAKFHKFETSGLELEAKVGANEFVKDLSKL